ncbi:MAG: hypothetical protein QXD98_01035 [Candidatus Diapherotrites archaeon]
MRTYYFVFFIIVFVFSSLTFGVQTCGGSHCHYWGTKPYTGNEPIPSVTMQMTFTPSAIPLQNSQRETYVVSPGTKLRLENINEYTLHCIDGASKDNPLAVRVLEKKSDSFVETSGNYSVKNYEVCRCDGIRNAVVGDKRSFDAYTFNSKGIYTLRIEYQKTTNASEWGLYKEFDVIVGPSDVEVLAPDKSIFGLQKNVYEIENSAEKSMRWEILNKGPLDIKIIGVYDTQCAEGLKQNCSFPDFEAMNNEITIEAGKSYLLLEKFVAKLPRSSPETTKAGLNIKFTDITQKEYDLSFGLKPVDVSVSFRPHAFALFPYRKRGEFVVEGGKEYLIQTCTDSPNNSLYDQPAFTANIFDETGALVATAGFHSISDCTNSNALRLLNSEGGLARFSVSGAGQKTYYYEVFGIVGIEGSYKSDFVRVNLSSEFDNTTQLLKTENSVLNMNLGPQRIVNSTQQQIITSKVNAFEGTKPLGFFSPQLSESPDSSSPITYTMTDITITSPEGTFTNPGPVKSFSGGKTEIFVVQNTTQGNQGFNAYAKTAYTENDPRPIKEFDLKLFWIDKERFMIGINSTNVGLCKNLEGSLIRGQQNNFATTGREAMPKVLYDWQPNNITEQTCSNPNNPIVCDSTQFMLSLLKRLQNIEQLASENKLEEANSKTSFNAYLMKDGFSNEFMRDWDEYYSQKFFTLDQSYNTKWKKYFSNPTNLRFSKNNNIELGKQVHEPGIYRVNIIMEFRGSAWEFFDALNNPKAQITINLEKINDLEPNILYMLPFDAELGLQQDGKYLRNGYGLGFKGEKIIISSKSASHSVETRETKSESTPVAWLEITIGKNFIDTQKNTAGNLLNITKKDGEENTYEVYFSPSTPFPAVLLAQPEPNTGFTAVSYSISDTTRGNINTGAYLAKLVESAYKPINAQTQCQDAETRAVLPISIGTDRERESNLTEPWCTFERANIFQKLYGFARQSNATILFETMFYPNSEGLILKNACLSAGKIYLAKLDSRGNIIGFVEIKNNSQYTFEIPTNSVKTFSEAIEQIQEERACIANSSIRQGNTLIPIGTGLWWNESKLVKDFRTKINNIEGIEVNKCYNN